MSSENQDLVNINYTLLVFVLFMFFYLNNKINSQQERFATNPNNSGDFDAIKNLGRIANELMTNNTVTMPGNLTVNGSLSTGGNINTGGTVSGGNINTGGSLTINNGGSKTLVCEGDKIAGSGRIHLVSGGKELIYFDTSVGVQIGREWGGSGNLNVQGNLNIGNTTTTNLLTVTGSSAYHFYYDGCYGWVNGSRTGDGCGNLGNDGNIKRCAAFQNGRVTIENGELNVLSDIRIKKNIVNISNSDALNCIRNIKPCTFRFIAQEIENIIPNTVSKDSNFIPNIFCGGSIISKNDNKYEILLEKEVNIDEIIVPCQVKILTKENKEIKCELLSITSNKLIIHYVNELEINQVIFIYGTFVNDLRTVNYDGIFVYTVGGLK